SALTCDKIKVMVQLGVKTNKGREIFEFFFAKSQPEVDREWVAENQLKMARIFMAGLEKYNLESSEETERVLLPEQFQLVAGYHIDEDTKTREFYDANEELATRTVTEAIYTNLLIGFSSEIQCLVLMKVDADLTRFGEVFVFYPKDFAKKKYRRFIERFEIYDQTEKWYERILMRLSAKHRTTFYVPSESLGTLTDVEGNPVLIYMSQAKMRERFVEFFNNWEQK
ncbi:MAG: hypothetical protein NNC33_01640, partial [Candidatus Nanosyncoccus sp. P13S_S20_bin.18.1]|nr:hypothetical protein [Candidatus Nanosyncoccus sp. P13S_S20_bin.18.1]